MSYSSNLKYQNKIFFVKIMCLFCLLILVSFIPIMGGTPFMSSDINFRNRHNIGMVRGEVKEEEKKVLAADIDADMDLEIDEKNNTSNWRLYQWGQSAVNSVQQCRKNRREKQQLKLKKQRLLELQEQMQENFPEYELTFDETEKIEQDHLDFAAVVKLKASKVYGTPEQFAENMRKQDDDALFAALLTVNEDLFSAQEEFERIQKLKNDALAELQASSRFVSYRDHNIPPFIIKTFELALEKVGINPQRINIGIKKNNSMAACVAGKHDFDFEKNELSGELIDCIPKKINNSSIWLYINPDCIDDFCSDPKFAEKVALHEAQHLLHGHFLVERVISYFVKIPRAQVALRRQHEFTADVFAATIDPHIANSLYFYFLVRAIVNPDSISDAIYAQPETTAQAILPILKAHPNNEDGLLEVNRNLRPYYLGKKCMVKFMDIGNKVIYVTSAVSAGFLGFILYKIHEEAHTILPILLYGRAGGS